MGISAARLGGFGHFSFSSSAPRLQLSCSCEVEELHSGERFCLGEEVFDEVLCVDTQLFCVTPLGLELVPLPSWGGTGVGFWQPLVVAVCAGLLLCPDSWL